MRTETVTESRDTVLRLTAGEAADLDAIGARLASRKAWWGTPESEADEESDRSVVRTRPLGDDRWVVRVHDAVGVVSTGTLQLIVQPKIPVEHLVFLLEKSGEFPRLDEQTAELAIGESMWELVARWFVDASERLLRLGLVRDYLEVTSTLETVSGRIELHATVAHYYAGRLAVDCTYDDYGYDTALNRVLLAALREVAQSRLLAPALRRRSKGLITRLDDVGELQPGDLAARLDRRTSHYGIASGLALHVLRHLGRHLTHRSDAAWTFLIRTPELVEAGIRALLADELGSARVTKEGRQLVGSSLTFNPDLVFDSGAAVGDVKYKLSRGDWNRADLYQTIAFAEAFGSNRGVVVRFRHPGIAAAPDLLVGKKSIHEVTWVADDSIPAAEAGRKMAKDVAAWIGSDSLARSA
jgi:hypothetical protein